MIANTISGHGIEYAKMTNTVFCMDRFLFLRSGASGMCQFANTKGLLSHVSPFASTEADQSPPCPASGNLWLRHPPKRILQLPNSSLNFERRISGKAHQEAGFAVTGGVERR